MFSHQIFLVAYSQWRSSKISPPFNSRMKQAAARFSPLFWRADFRGPPVTAERITRERRPQAGQRPKENRWFRNSGGTTAGKEGNRLQRGQVFPVYLPVAGTASARGGARPHGHPRGARARPLLRDGRCRQPPPGRAPERRPQPGRRFCPAHLCCGARSRAWPAGQQRSRYGRSAPPGGPPPPRLQPGTEPLPPHGGTGAPTAAQPGGTARAAEPLFAALWTGQDPAAGGEPAPPPRGGGCPQPASGPEGRGRAGKGRRRPRFPPGRSRRSSGGGRAGGEGVRGVQKRFPLTTWQRREGLRFWGGGGVC